MSSQVFNEGDLVLYTSRDIDGKIDSLNPRNGSIGVVRGVNRTYRESKAAYDVTWHEGEMLRVQRGAISYAAWTRCLDLAELKYDPNQQGDLEDDI